MKDAFAGLVGIPLLNLDLNSDLISTAVSFKTYKALLNSKLEAHQKHLSKTLGVIIVMGLSTTASYLPRLISIAGLGQLLRIPQTNY